MDKHDPDWPSLVAGVVFVAAGVIALAAGSDRFADALVWIWPAALLGLGVAMVVRSAREDRSRDEISPERSEDREVEQAGRSHDG